MPRRERVGIMGKKIKEVENIDTQPSDEVIVALRSVQQSQVRLNVLADQKANINIGFALLFITLGQSPLVAEVSTQDSTRWGVLLVTLSVAISLTLALLVVSPRTGGARVSKAEQMANPFYFGMFTQLDQDTYVDYMRSNLNCNRQARRMILVDIYQIGRVLKRKYRLLRFSYAFLAASAILSAAIFIYETQVLGA
jgi:hypothetical protein